MLGAGIERFEQNLAALVGCKHAAGIGNGLDALDFARAEVAVVPGNEAVVPAHTFIAAWLAAHMLGARPVPADLMCPAASTQDRRRPRPC